MHPKASLTPSRSLPSLLADLSALINSTISLPATPPLLASLLEQLNPVVDSLYQTRFSDYATVVSTLELLQAELNHANSLVRAPGGPHTGLLQLSVREIGRRLGLVQEAWVDVPVEVKEGVDMLKAEMVGLRFEGVTKKKNAGVVADVEDLVVRIKTGDEEGIVNAGLEIDGLIEESVLVPEECAGLISALFGRICLVKSDCRVKILSMLRRLAGYTNCNKEKMSSSEYLSSIVRCLSRDEEERREAVGLLVDISDVSKVRQRIGRIKGCIVMLVALQNGDDLIAKSNAEKLLGTLSNSTQNVLLMAEAGYFAPMIHLLNEGSDMNKILMASAISKMRLTEQTKASLGEQGSIEPLVKIFTAGNLEAKSSALGAIRNLSSSPKNIQLLLNSGIISPLFQLLFSVTSVLMTLREPASSLLATLAKSEDILLHKSVPQKTLSLVNLSSASIQLNLLNALTNITSHQNSKRARTKVRENGAIQLLLPFLTSQNKEIRVAALNLLFNLSKDCKAELDKPFLEETYIAILVNVVTSQLASDSEKTAAIGTLSNLPIKDEKITEILMKANLVPLLVYLLGTKISNELLVERIAGLFIRFTIPSNKKVQNASVTSGVITSLVTILSEGSIRAKSKAAVSLSQLSQNTLALSKVKSSRSLRLYPSSETRCEVHGGYCTVKSTFCLVKAGAVSPLVRILEGNGRKADENVLEALSTLMQDEIWERGVMAIEKASGIEAIIKIVEVGNLKAQEKAIWILERAFRIERNREKYGEVAQVLLIDLAQKGNQILRPMIGKILAHLQLLQLQPSYFGDAS
ncbi:U-box domain-containing protein 43 [Rhynchospora pubera]|uniref:U-box domain-containing protein 43 n=1 Tax=Rhynchospora pubera TaxID=906938 RepID=A0AAV8GKH6_9POAL|nr:U-box domain-containing protein 43 [Rhynchospora pubera]